MSEIRITFLGTGAGASIHRAHTAIALDCAGGFRILLDAGSGNSVMRSGAEAGMFAESFDTVLLSHAHSDHMSGLPHIQGQRTMVKPEGPPMEVYSAELSLQRVQSLFRATSITHSVNEDGVTTSDGTKVVSWRYTHPGQRIQLSDKVWASCFAVDHIQGAMGWRVESDGVAVVFSGDTRFSENLAAASHGADLLIHEALCTDADTNGASSRGHSTAGEAARAAAIAQVKSLTLTHIDNPFHLNTQALLDDARTHFDGPIDVATDLYQITVGSP